MLRKKIDDEANVQMIGMVVGVLVTLIIAVLIFYNIAASVDLTTADRNIAENVYGMTGEDITNDNITFGANATDDTLDQAATFFTVAPIVAIVIVAVIILKYVGDI